MKNWLTDTEKRILFAALSREKEVCKEVDKECCREAYEIPLENVCKSLENKFYYDKLFKTIEKETCREFAEKVKQMMKMPEYGFCDTERIMEIALEEMEQVNEKVYIPRGFM